MIWYIQKIRPSIYLVNNNRRHEIYGLSFQMV